MIHSQNKQWTRLQKFALRFWAAYFILFITSFSFSQPLMPDVGAWLSPLYEKFVKWFATYIFQIKQPYTALLISDSTGFYIHAFILVILSLLFSLACGKFYCTKNYCKLWNFLCAGIRYYLALQMLTYGLNKVFKWQFYQPEPNILFTPAGFLYKDIFFWSAMGTSGLYSMLTGMLEVVAGLLLLFRKTHLIGALLSFVCLLQIIIVNLSFDISVKLLSIFLLLANGILLLPYLSMLYRFLSFKNVAPITSYSGWYVGKRWYYILKPLIVCWLIANVLFIYFTSGNFNDDKAERPLLHGAYQVKVFIRNNDTIPLLLYDTTLFKRVFIHRRGYFIVQRMNDGMQDFILTYNIAKNKLLLQNERKSLVGELMYSIDKNNLLLKGKLSNDSLILLLQKIDIKKLPALQDSFGWTIDN